MKLTYKEMKDALDVVGSIAINESVHTFHCKHGHNNDRLYITNTGDAYLFYCHHCNAKGVIKQQRSTYKKHKRANDDSFNAPEARVSYNLPYDMSLDLLKWPPEAVLWPTKAYLQGSDVKALEMAYSEKLGMVVVPLYFDGVYNGWLGRRIKGEGSKYLARFKDKEKNIAIFRVDSSDRVVLCEDILSAYRLSRAGYNAVALLGTSVKGNMFSYLSTRYKQFDVWLDNDNPQVKLNQTKLLRRFGLIGKARLIKTDKDPKEYTDDEIVEILDEDI